MKAFYFFLECILKVLYVLTPIAMCSYAWHMLTYWWGKFIQNPAIYDIFDILIPLIATVMAFALAGGGIFIFLMGFGFISVEDGIKFQNPFHVGRKFVKPEGLQMGNPTNQEQLPPQQ